MYRCNNWSYGCNEILQKDDRCIAVGKYSRGIIIDQNNEPISISNVKNYEDSIKGEERSISSAEGEFEVLHGV